MSPRKRRRATKKTKVKLLPAARAITPDPHEWYEEACRLAESGRYDEARKRYRALEPHAADSALSALIQNDLAVLDALEGDAAAASARLECILQEQPHCAAARENFDLLAKVLLPAATTTDDPPARTEKVTGPICGNGPSGASQELDLSPFLAPSGGSVKVALLSFLFNWPSTGGGIIHTVELAQFLGKAGYEVRHFFVRFAPWGIGQVEGELPYASHALEFDEASWRVEDIQGRIREAIDGFAPDYAIITDSWNFKPHLAAAVRGYPYLLRFQAPRPAPPGPGGSRRRWSPAVP